MRELDYVAKLETDLNFYHENLNNLYKFYNLRNEIEIIEYISSHKGIIVYLNEIKPYLSRSFPTGIFDLIFDVDPEVNELSQIVIYVKVDEYTFDNGVMDTIKNISFDFIALRQKLGIMGKVSLMPALYNW